MDKTNKLLSNLHVFYLSKTVFGKDMIFYIENTRANQNTYDFSQVAVCNINIQKSFAFIYANDETSEKEVKLSHSQ